MKVTGTAEVMSDIKIFVHTIKPEDAMSQVIENSIMLYVNGDLYSDHPISLRQNPDIVYQTVKGAIPQWKEQNLGPDELYLGLNDLEGRLLDE